MNKTCLQCQSTFEVTDKDLAFYKKLDLTSPTLCPICRVKRRMAWRNDRSFYIRKCDRSNETFVSIYPEKTEFPVYKPSQWYKDDWDPRKYGQEIDFKRPFFEQWNELKNKVPRLGIDIVHCENSEYCNYCGDDKNCYLDIAGEANEDCYYNLFTKFSKNCVDNTFVYHSELCYESLFCHQCHTIKYSMYLENCHDCNYCFDLKDCHNCTLCSNLRHKSYNILNKQYTKEEYAKKLEELESQKALTKDNWKQLISKSIHRDMYNTQTENCTGDNIKNSKNCEEAYNVVNSWDCKFLYDVLDAKDCYDLNYSLYKPEVACELISTLNMRYSAFNMASHYCHNVFYCDQCNNSDYLFGCIAINRGHYCILNKQYTEEEYKKLFPKLITHMQKTGEWGEFFPAKYSPHRYDETVAQEYYPTQAKKQQTKTSPTEADPQKGIYICKTCSKKFKVIPQEAAFYKRLSIETPTSCPDCRHFERNKLRNPRNLRTGTCSKCKTKIQTTHPKESSPKTIYCEKCYLETLY